jgi:hypothetical protein
MCVFTWNSPTSLLLLLLLLLLAGAEQDQPHDALLQQGQGSR